MKYYFLTQSYEIESENPHLRRTQFINIAGSFIAVLCEMKLRLNCDVNEWSSSQAGFSEWGTSCLSVDMKRNRNSSKWYSKVLQTIKDIKEVINKN